MTDSNCQNAVSERQQLSERIRTTALYLMQWPSKTLPLLVLA